MATSDKPGNAQYMNPAGGIAGQALARSFEWSRLAASVEEVLLGAMMPAPCAPVEAKLRVT